MESSFFRIAHNDAYSNKVGGVHNRFPEDGIEVNKNQAHTTVLEIKPRRVRFCQSLLSKRALEGRKLER